MKIRTTSDDFKRQIQNSINELKTRVDEDEEYESVDDMVWENKEEWAEILFNYVMDNYGWEEFN